MMCHPKEALERQERGKVTKFEIDPENPRDQNDKYNIKQEWAITNYK